MKVRKFVRARATWLSAAAVLGAALSATGLVWVLDHTSTHTGEALATITTIALVVVTAFYVNLTHRLVVAQERPIQAIRLAAQEESARAFVVFMWNEGRDAYDLLALFPIKTLTFSEDFNTQLTESYRAMRHVANHLAANAFLLPEQFSADAWGFTQLTFGAAHRAACLCSCILEEHLSAMTERRPPDPDKARVAYYAKVRDTIVGTPEWSDLLKGDGIVEVCHALKGFERAVGDYVSGLAVSQP